MSRYHHTREWHYARKAAKERDGYRCQQCGKAGMLEVHHLRSLSQGGDNELDNLRTLCRGCHIQLHYPKPKVQTEWAYMVQELL